MAEVLVTMLNVDVSVLPWEKPAQFKRQLQKNYIFKDMSLLCAAGAQQVVAQANVRQIVLIQKPQIRMAGSWIRRRSTMSIRTAVL